MCERGEFIHSIRTSRERRFKFFMLRTNVLKGVVAITCSFVLLVPSLAVAQGRVSFNISPTTIEDKAEPGAEMSFTMRVENKGDVDSILYPVARNIASIATNHQPVYMEGPEVNQSGLASWISYEESSLNVLAGSGAVLHFTVHFPMDARPGSHMAGLFLTQKPPDNLKQGSAVGFDIGAILHFQMAGDIIEDTRMREFRTDKFVYGAPSVTFMVSAENMGNTLSRPQGIIDITDMFGNKIVPSPRVNETAYVISPNGTGEYKVVWEPDGFAIGRFEAVLALAVPMVDGGNKSLSAITQFWILPMNIIGPVLGGILTFVFVLYVLVKLYVRRQLAGLGVRGGSAASVRGARGISRLAAVAIGLLIAIIVGLLMLFFAFG